jgi:hypothetical protein
MDGAQGFRRGGAGRRDARRRTTGDGDLIGGSLRALRARRLGFTSSKRSGGQGDPYPGVLDGGLGS